jgi:KaiC/GvpD/RAD55 family RecA-like ATPase
MIVATDGVPSTLRAKFEAAQLLADASPTAMVTATLLDQCVELDLTAPRVTVRFLATPTLGVGLFYEGHLAIISGHKKAGKTLATMSVALDVIEAGGVVVYLDFENGDDLIANRLRDMGADAGEIAARFKYIPFPKGLTLANFRGQLESVAEAHPGATLVVDSLRGLFTRLSMTGKTPLSINDPTSIEQVLGPLSEVVKTANLTAVVIDHAKKVGTSDDEYATAGSAGKEQVADAVYFLSKVEPFSEAEQGVVALKASSDRLGKLPIAPLHYRVGGQGEGNRFTFERVDAGQVGASGQVRQNVVQYLCDTAPAAHTQTVLEQAVDGKAATIRDALKTMANDPASPVRQVPGDRAGRWKYTYDESITTTTPEPGI